MKLRRRYYGLLFLLLFAVTAYVFWRSWLGPRLILQAIRSEDTNRITLIVKSGIDPDADIFLVGGLLHCAAARDSTPSMEALISLGADINRLDGYGVTPLMVSTKMDSPEAYRWLVANGANETLVSREGKTAKDYLSYLSEEARNRFIEDKK